MRDFMRLMAIVGASMAVGSYAKPEVDPISDFAPDFFPKQRRGKGQNNRRGKGKRSAPKRRPNRLLISKRVRRKHRRAA